MILADHCVFSTTIRLLQREGYATTRLQELIEPSASDQKVLRLAIQKDLVLLTNDKGFGNIRIYPPAEHQGVILLRIGADTESQVHRVLLQLLRERGRDDFRQRLAVVDHSKYRMRAGQVEKIG